VAAHDEPAGQLIHDVARAIAYRPAEQATGLAVRLAQKKPAGHEKQAVEEPSEY
jgi:hypothetical protein